MTAKRALADLGLRLVLLLPPEMAHRITIRALTLMPERPPPADDARLHTRAFGLDFPNPLGLAAGFDKNGEVADAMLRLGFGFVEVGTVTPRPQSGNPRPRLFRLKEDHAIINRLGFNSAGHERVRARLLARAGQPGLVALNLGANRDSEDRIGDYLAGIETFADLAQMFVINISSPNTPGLRDLQRQQELSDLLPRVLAARDAGAARRPVIVKIAPDLTEDELDGIVRVCRAHRIDGLAVSNTTLARPELTDEAKAKEIGGLSGRPLFVPATRILAQAYLRVENQFPLIGIGGVEDAATAFAKIEAGATLLELYSGLVFKGAGLIGEIKRGLLGKLEKEGRRSLEEVRGRRAEDWAEGRITDLSRED
ncbi:MAG TPA: quinone-dependent dihydroorotate dehydrogenase [Methylovirgula sp.]|nr:quinone-dependent dihydroorotate dehydrogenase [Methylovirgula sp.]